MLLESHLKDYFRFPSPHLAEDGLLCMGGELSPEMLISAYRQGVFPWYNEGDEIMWWSPEPRCVVRPGALKVSKSMKPVLSDPDLRVKSDTQFDQVIRHCQQTKRKGQDGTWLIDDMMEAYLWLHDLGIAHSIEVYVKERLVGGLYGLSLGNMFYGESMFSLESNMSKVGFITLSNYLKSENFELIDCQVVNPHLVSMGCVEMSREDFLDLNARACEAGTRIGAWTDSVRNFCDQAR